MWPKVEFGDRGFLSSSRLAGPWYGNGQEGGKEEGERRDLEEGKEGESGKPRRSYTLQRSEGYDIDKRQVLVEKVVEEEVVVGGEGTRIEEGGGTA